MATNLTSIFPWVNVVNCGESFRTDSNSGPANMQMVTVEFGAVPDAAQGATLLAAAPVTSPTGATSGLDELLQPAAATKAAAAAPILKKRMREYMRR